MSRDLERTISTCSRICNRTFGLIRFQREHVEGHSYYDCYRSAYCKFNRVFSMFATKGSHWKVWRKAKKKGSTAVVGKRQRREKLNLSKKFGFGKHRNGCRSFCNCRADSHHTLNLLRGIHKKSDTVRRLEGSLSQERNGGVEFLRYLPSGFSSEITACQGRTIRNQTC